jgi:5-formyltetrahydrofolate cyclo-ligase
LSIGGEKGEKARRRRFSINLGSGFREPASDFSTLQRKSFHVLDVKNCLRRYFLEIRENLSSIDAYQRSERIQRYLFELGSFRSACKIAVYYPIKNEVRTEKIFECAKELKKEVYLPRIEDAFLTFQKVNSLSELKLGRFGIPAPRRDSNKIEIEDIDLIVIPGVAFDCFGARIGYGKGYYDRAISQIDIKKRIGLAYDFQVLDLIPSERYDEKVGLIITESGVITCERRM